MDSNRCFAHSLISPTRQPILGFLRAKRHIAISGDNRMFVNSIAGGGVVVFRAVFQAKEGKKTFAENWAGASKSAQAPFGSIFLNSGLVYSPLNVHARS